MANVFLLLFLISLALLVFGLVRPKVLKGRDGVPMTRKQVGIGFGLTALAFFILTGITAPKSANTSTTKTPAKSSASQSPSKSITPSPTASPKHSASPSASPKFVLSDSDRICQVGGYYLKITSAQAHNFSACGSSPTWYQGTIDDLLALPTIDRRCLSSTSSVEADQAIIGVYSDTKSADLSAAKAFCSSKGWTNDASN